MKPFKAKNIFITGYILSLSIGCLYAYGNSDGKCVPFLADEVIKQECVFYIDSSNDTFCNVRLRLDDGFKGSFAIDRQSLEFGDLKVTAVSGDTTIYLNPMLDKDCILYTSDAADEL